MANPYATQEDSKSLWYEQSNYVSTHLASIGYGIHLAVFAILVYYILLARPRMKTHTWVFWLGFNTLLFAFGTINLATSIKYNENAWVSDRGYPGGPFNYLIEQGDVGFATLGNVASILASFLSDGLLLYRAGVLWNFSWIIVVPPALFFIACIILSVMTVIQLALPMVALPQLSLAVWIVLMILPIWLTILIAGRILYHRRTMIDALGREYVQNYTGIVAVVIESAVPFAIISIVLLGLFGAENTAQNLFVPLMVQVECIAPELIVLRVVRGRSWTKDTLTGQSKDSDMHFASPHRREEESELNVASPGLGTKTTRSGTTEGAKEEENRTSIVVLKDSEKMDNTSSRSAENIV